MYRCWPPVAAARCGFIMVLFTTSRGNTFVRGIIALPNAILVSLRSAEALFWHLHWLPTDCRISFKLFPITFKALGSGRPPYLASLLHNYSPPRTMHSSSATLLTVPRHNLSLGLCAFCISAPTTWNSLLQNAGGCSSLASFRNHLKRHCL